MARRSEELEWLTLKEVFLIIDCHSKKIEREWQQVRMLGFWSMKAAGAKKIKKPSDLMKLPSDNIQVVQASKQAVDAYLNKWKQKNSSKDD